MRPKYWLATALLSSVLLVPGCPTHRWTGCCCSWELVVSASTSVEDKLALLLADAGLECESHLSADQDLYFFCLSEAYESEERCRSDLDSIEAWVLELDPEGAVHCQCPCDCAN